MIVTDEQDMVKEILRLTAGKGVSLFDPVGGPTFAMLAQATAHLGIAVSLRRLEHRADSSAVIRRAGQVAHGPGLRDDGNHRRSASDCRRAKEFINGGLADGSLRPIVAKTFPFDQIVESHRYLESNQQFGKVVVTV